MKKYAFTLAEVLITLAIIGVVAALTVPSVISNSQQQEFRTGLRKAVSVLNSAITMNMALDGETPYDNANLFGYLMKHMAVVSSFTRLEYKFYTQIPHTGENHHNAAFYTTDGMRFEIRSGANYSLHKLHESDVFACFGGASGTLDILQNQVCGGCGSYGLKNNTYHTTKPPCVIMVDVNGDKKPNPSNVDCHHFECGKPYKYADIKGVRLTDVFTIMITDREAIPYGIAAQRAMYQAQK